MTSTDPDQDERPQYQRIADAIRGDIEAGRYEPGDRLPGQTELADIYGAARETVRRALEVLREERRVFTRQGSGSFVRAVTERAVQLRPHLQAAFEARSVVIDFFGFTSETLANALAEPLDLVRDGKLTPDSIRLRLLVTDMDAPVPVPRSASSGTDDQEVRARESRIIDRSVQSVRHAVSELPRASIEVKALATPPLCKLYLVNRTEAWFGFYEVVTRPVPLKGKQVDIVDVLGKDSLLFPMTAGEEDGAAWVDAAQRWFDSWWTTAHDYE
jgi:DNA-binding transcriptional regulator YhcF (GntR family)